MKARNAVESVIAAFDHANLVALGERHWAREDAQFRLEVIRNPAFTQKANDIVIECGNPLYQRILDRFIDGESVSDAELQRVWRDTTQPGAWDSPVYEEFLHAVRAVNANLPPHRRVRVLAADSPIDWSAAATPCDLGGTMQDRDRSAAAVIRQEVLNRGRKALVIFGSAHLYRGRPGTIADLLKDDSRAKWFLVAPLGGPGLPKEIASRQAKPEEPVLLTLAGDAAGHLPAADVLEIGSKRLQVVDGKPVFEDGKPVFLPVFEGETEVGELADACLFFGEAPPEFVPPPTGLHDDSEYGREIQRRRNILRLAMYGPRAE